MKLFENLPLIVFGLVFLISSIFLIIGIFVSSSAKDTVRLEKGKKILMRAVFSFSSLLLIVVVFLSVTWFLDMNAKEEPKDLDAYPVSPVDPNFPSAPEFIKISNTYFSGPYPFRDYSLFPKTGIFSILCENGDDYDIIDIDSAGKDTDLRLHENIDCWASACQDLRIGVIWQPSGEGVIWDRSATLKFLKNENVILCPIEE